MKTALATYAGETRYFDFLIPDRGLAQLAAVLEKAGVEINEVRSLGGAARSGLWLQMKADTCSKDFITMECDEAASLGVAMLACVGGGVYKDLAEARDNMVKTRGRISPSEDGKKAYADAYARYLRLDSLARDAG